MSSSDDKLFVFHDEKDRSLARQMGAGVDLSGIRKTYRTDADGTTHRLSTRAGFPEIVTTKQEVSVQESTTVLRGYAANLYETAVVNSEGYLLSRWLGVVKRVSGLWAKWANRPQYGAYSVVGRWTVGQPIADVLAFFNNKLYRNGLPLKYEKAAELGTSALPVVLLKDEDYPAGANNDDEDFHLFGVGDTKLMHLSGRNVGWSPTEVYSADALDALTDGYPTPHFAGVDHNRLTNKVNYNHWYVSMIGALALRFQSLTLSSTAPYYADSGYTSQNCQATAYVFPDGAAVTTPGTTWVHPIMSGDLGIMEQYNKVGTPGPGPALSYGVYEADGFFQGNPVQSGVVSSTVTLAGHGAYSTTIPGGYYGDSLITFDVLLDATANMTWVDSSGAYRLACPSVVAAVNQSDSPPSYSYQFRSFYESTGSANPGDLLGEAISSSTSTDKTWQSVSVMLCASPATSATFFAQVTVSGGYSLLNTMDSTNKSIFMFNGQECGLASMDVPYYAMYNAVKILNQKIDDLGADSMRDFVYDTVEVLPHSTHSMVGTTRDFILFDLENDTYVRIDGTFSGAKDAPFDVLMELVVSRNGAEYRKELFHALGGGILIPTDLVYDIARYFAPIMPPRVFAPPYCKQGLFKYAAYSEAPDTPPDSRSVSYADDVFLMSLPLAITQTGSVVPVPKHAMPFTPLNFYAMLGSFGGISSADMVRPLAEGVIFYCHFADGQWRDWPADVQAGLGDHFSEVYRT